MKKIIVIVWSVLALSACNKFMDGINEDPNSPTSAPYGNILTGAEVGSIIVQTGATARMASFFCNYYTGIQRQYKGYSEYAVTSSDFDKYWREGFINALRNAKEAENTAEYDGVRGVTRGITQVLQALTFGTETALFGDIPFDEVADIEIENPKFEPQKEVYKKTQLLLDSAIVNLETNKDRPSGGTDIYFDGDPQSWIEVAYTLKGRFYMHTKEYDKAYTVAQKGIKEKSHAMYAPHGTAEDNANLTYQLFDVETRKADLVVSDFMASLILPDPGENPDFANYRGNAKTDETARYHFYFHKNAVGIQPNVDDGFAAKDAPAPIVTYAENLLILAEAGLRSQGFQTGLEKLNDFRAFMTTGGYMRNVNTADLRYDAYSSSDFENGGMENQDGIAKKDALLREILEERYVTLFAQIEGFNDMRRTQNETKVRVPVKPNKGNKLPQRFLYPQSEIDRNDNVPEPLPGLFHLTAVNK